MTKINTHIRGNNININPTIEGHISKKVIFFEKYIHNETADLYVEIGKTTEHHKNGDIFRAEFNLRFPGREFRSEAQSSDLFTAIELAKDEMVEELRTAKDRDTTMFRRGARKIKDIVRKIYPLS